MASLGDIINNVVGEEGIKTDVKISLAPKDYINLGLSIFLAVMAVWIVSKMLEKIIFNG